MINTPLVTVSDARSAAKRRLPRMIFDYIDGAAGNEYGCGINQSRLEEIRLQPRVLVNTEDRSLKKTLFGREWDLPFGIAPMGMCNLSWPGGDEMLAAAAVKHNIPVGLSTMASSSIEQTFDRAGTHAWFQLYVGQSEEVAFNMVDRARICGYETIMLTVDVPILAPRTRERRNGFQSPVKIGPRQFLDFAIHPQWSIRTLLTGIPKIANNENDLGQKKFVRNESRGKVDWGFLDRLRNHWKGNLIVKGVLHCEDAVRIRDAGVDGVYISNHGGRQLDSAPAAIDTLGLIREAVGRDYPLLFDSGVRNGESVIKALAMGADFVLMGRPFLYGMGANGQQGLEEIIRYMREEINVGLTQLGKTDINDVDSGVLFSLP